MTLTGYVYEMAREKGITDWKDEEVNGIQQ